MFVNRYNGFPKSEPIRIRKQETVETVHESRKALVNPNLKVGENEMIRFHTVNPTSPFGNYLNPTPFQNTVVAV